MLSKLESYGDHRGKFERDWKKVLDGLNQSDSEIQEKAFCEWGSFLGYESERPQGQGTPDGIWQLGSIWPVFEMKTNIEDPDGDIPLDDIRQTYFHESYVRKQKFLKEDDSVITIMICPKQ